MYKRQGEQRIVARTTGQGRVVAAEDAQHVDVVATQQDAILERNAQVHGIARHSETEELLVVYTALYGERGLWVRPLGMFQETVQRDGRELPRFEYIGEK